MATREEGLWPVVVVSAIGRRGMPYATDTLIGLLHDVEPPMAPEARELDLIMACGEVLSAAVFAHQLKALGYPAAALTGAQAGVQTDGVYGDARVVAVDEEAVRLFLDRRLIPIVCGFQGILEGTQEVATLGRGGSDTTAAALGVGLKAEEVVIFTDVDGVMTADPRLVPEAMVHRSVSYAEVCEMAHLGAKVLHPRAAEIAGRHGLKMSVRNTFSSHPGSQIVSEPPDASAGITGVTLGDALAFAQVDAVASPQTVLDALERQGLSIRLLNLVPGGMTFALDVGRADEVGTLLRQVAPEAKVVTIAPTRLVSVIGRERHQRAGVFFQALSTLKEAGIPVLQTADSEYAVGMLVASELAEQAVRHLHKAFQEEC